MYGMYLPFAHPNFALSLQSWLKTMSYKYSYKNYKEKNLKTKIKLNKKNPKNTYKKTLTKINKKN